MRIEDDPISRSDDDALDRLLAQATWPALDEAAISRLRTTLASQSIASSSSNSRRWWGVAIAASVIIGIGLAAILLRNQSSPRQIVQIAPPTTPVAVASRSIKSTITARPANSYEMAVLLSQHPVTVALATLPATLPPATPAVASQTTPSAAPSVASPTTPSAVVAEAPAPDVPTLIASLDDATKRDNAIKLLAKVASPSELVKVASDPKTSRETRSAMCAVLLTRADLAGADGYLQLVQTPNTRDIALDVLRNFDHPPVNALVAQLDAPLVDRRYAAARALGCLCHGPTFAVLQGMVEKNVNRREAMIALLYCPNPAAKEYLDQLRGRPVLSQQLQAVQTEIRSVYASNI